MRVAKTKPDVKNRIAANGNGHSNGGAITIHDARSMFGALTSIMGTRAAVSSYLGKSYGGDRDIYEALGRNKLPQFNDYMARYLRQDIAKAIIDVPVNACWRKTPKITESEEDETAFEKSWELLAKKLSAYRYFSRVDRLASIGEYAVLLIGFNDSAQMWQPVRRATDVLYLMPYSQANASISTYVTDTKDPRYSLPETYSINMRGSGAANTITSKKVHWSRVLHVTEDNLDDDIRGLPRLQAVLNVLQDLELVAGGCGEMFWRGAFPGFGLKADPDYQFTDQTEAQIEDEANEYVHKMRRFMRLTGVSIENIAQQIADPSPQATLFMKLISATSRIPMRILFGSEQGELASSQDEVNWYATVDERRTGHCEPMILRAFVNRCIDVKVLPTPKDDYQCEWPELLRHSEKEKAEIAKIKTEALSTYAQSGVEVYMPPEFYLEHVHGYDRDDLDKLDDMLETQENDADGDGNETISDDGDPDASDDETNDPEPETKEPTGETAAE